jgi:hypothetical protein
MSNSWGSWLQKRSLATQGRSTPRLSIEHLEDRTLLSVTVLQQDDNIAAAVAAASPGDTILLKPGIYTVDEDIVIDKSLTLKGFTLNAANVQIIPGTVNGDGITIEDTGSGIPFRVTIANLSVNGWDFDGIDADAVTNLTLTNVILNQNGQVGGDGLDADASQSVTLFKVVANNNGDDGIDVFGLNGSRPDIIGKVVTANFNGDDGITLELVDSVNVSNATANSNGIIGGDGIEVTDASGSVTFSNSQANLNGTEDGDYGFDLYDIPAGIILTAVTANGNYDDGLHVEAGDLEFNGDITILKSTFNNNGILTDGGSPDADGVDLEDVDDVKLVGVTAKGNREDGVDVDGAAGSVTIQGGLFNDNGRTFGDLAGDGIDLFDIGGRIKVEKVVANNNQGYGLLVEGVGNIVNGTFLPISSTAAVQVLFGQFNNNGDDGIHLCETAGDILVKAVTASFNREDGLEIANSNPSITARVLASIFRNNLDNGIDRGDFAGTFIQSGNFFKGNGDGNINTLSDDDDDCYGGIAG